MRQTKPDFDDVSANTVTHRQKRRMLSSPKNRLGRPASRSCEQGYQKGSSGFKGDPLGSKRITRPDRKWPEAQTQLSKKQMEEVIAEKAEVTAELQSARCIKRESTRFRPNDKDHLNVIAAARLKMEKRLTFL